MTRREYCYQHYEHQHYCFNCSHIEGLHPKGSCTLMVKTRKEWYILGNVKLAEAIVSEPCKPLVFSLPHDHITRSNIFFEP